MIFLSIFDSNIFVKILWLFSCRWGAFMDLAFIVNLFEIVRLGGSILRFFMELIIIFVLWLWVIFLKLRMFFVFICCNHLQELLMGDFSLTFFWRTDNFLVIILIRIIQIIIVSIDIFIYLDWWIILEIVLIVELFLLLYCRISLLPLSIAESFRNHFYSFCD